MMKMKLFLISVLLLLPRFLFSQDVKEILAKSIQAVKELKQSGYHFEMSQTNPMNGDTMNISMECMLKKVEGDTITGMYFYFSEPNSGFNKYDGTAYYEYNPEYQKNIVRYSVKDNPDKFKPVVLPIGIAPPAATSSFGFSKSLLKSYEDMEGMLKAINKDSTLTADKILPASDTLIDNQPCFVIKTAIHGKHGSYSTLVCLAKQSLLPLLIITDSKGGSIMINNESISMEQYTKVKYSNIAPDLFRFDYYLGDESLPAGIAVLDHDLQLSNPQLIKKGDNAPSWAFPELVTQKTISSDSLKGKLLILDITSSWCFHCAEGSNAMKMLYQKYGNRKDVLFLNVFSSSLDNREKIEKYVKNRSLEGLTLYDAGSIEKPYGIFGYPNFYIIDFDGKILFTSIGYDKSLPDTMSEEIEKYLK